MYGIFIDLHLGYSQGFNVGKYSSTMEHMGIYRDHWLSWLSVPIRSSLWIPGQTWWSNVKHQGSKWYLTSPANSGSKSTHRCHSHHIHRPIVHYLPWRFWTHPGSFWPWREAPDQGDVGKRKSMENKTRTKTSPDIIWLVVSTPLQNISQLGWLFPLSGK